MNQKVKECLNLISEELASKHNPVYATQMEAYMKNKFSYYGIKAPLRREVLKPFFQHVKTWDTDDLALLIEACWQKEQREYCYAAMDILGKNIKKLDSSWIPITVGLIQNKSWWDTVDFLASTVMGHLLRDEPLKVSYVDSWINDNDIWMKRTAILFQLKYKDQTDFDLLQSLIKKEIHHSDFFIRKAIGWSLRQYSRIDPQAVKSFVHSHPQLSNLSKREALKYV